jgi:thioredoxin 1
MDSSYQNPGPAASEVEALRGAAVLEFGTDWCGVCRGAQGAIREGLAGHPEVRHMKVEDGPGRPLGRAFKVKLWPTLIFLRDGKEVGRLVRPREAGPIRDALAQATTTA